MESYSACQNNTHIRDSLVVNYHPHALDLFVPAAYLLHLRLTERRRSRQKVCCNCMRLNSSHGSKWRVCLEVDHRHFDTPPQPRCTVEKTFEWSPTSPIQTGRRGENGTKLNGNAMKEMRERRLYSAIYTSNISARTAVQYFVLHE